MQESQIDDNLRYLLERYISSTSKGKPNKRSCKNLITAIQAKENYLIANTGQYLETKLRERLSSKKQ